MTTAPVLSAADTTRRVIGLSAAPGLPPLPHIPSCLCTERLSPEQREANLLHVALWITERDSANLDMKNWHKAWKKLDQYPSWSTCPSGEKGFHACGTAHCLAGFAQAMCGPQAFELAPRAAGTVLLGYEAAEHFNDSDFGALNYLMHVIKRNS